MSFVTANGDGTYDVVNNVGGFNTALTDIDDGGDNPLILGDVDPDVFQITNGNQFTYVAALQNGDGFIASWNSGGSLYAFQYNTYYGVGATLTAVDQDFAIQCFTTGTRIETTIGPVAIERLAVGDVAVTASGGERKIVWIGQRTIACSGEYWHMAPVRVRANAFGAGVPERDVFLSPGHPVLVRQNGVEVLVPIMNLINGTTIERTQMQSVTYWHIELDQHDVLLADGLPAESFFDMGSRAWFDNDLDNVLANPDLVPAGQHGRCREVAIDGPLVDAERKRLADLFYADLSAQCAWPSAGAYAAA
ncbi:Hint domain-containing protein [Jiella pelagia]|uniref:Hint domain-containing protein n=1 Tax=Jiella pelagia TaxID=2986949 RepID=A0ABY7C128_9HYPH|nr:Hint domain-containing protein [Jiella pelagia]WAP69564.1 Hint domain-containing protein [Jiella pelagia]